MGGVKKPYCAYRAVVFFFLLLIAAPAGGETLRIKSVAIEGAHHFSRQAIKGVMYLPFPSWFSRLPLVRLPRYDSRDLVDDVESIKNLYASAGYFNAEVTSLIQEVKRNKTVRIVIRIREGESFRIESLSVSVTPPNPRINSDTLRGDLTLREGMPFTESAYDTTLQNLVDRCQDSGYPQAQVTRIARVYKKRSRIQVDFTVVPGPFRRFGPVRVSENSKIAPRDILQEITIERGQPFSRSRMEESQKRIYGLGLFRSVILVPEERGAEESVPVTVRIDEAPLRRFLIGLGYGTEDNLRARIEWTRKYFLDQPLTLHLAARHSSLIESITADAYKRYFLNQLTSLSLFGGFERENYSTYVNERISARSRAMRRLCCNLESFLGYNLEVDRPVSVAEAQQDLVNTQPGEFYFISSVIAGLSHDTVGNDLNPSRGAAQSVSVETASYYLGSQIDYLKANLDARWFVPLSGGVVGAVRGAIGLIEPRRYTRVIPLFKRYYTGGSNSVRGYAYRSLGPVDTSGQPTGGNYLFEGSLELRFPSGMRNLTGVVFVDAGNVFETWPEARQANLKYGTGGGLRYNTPIGPVRVDIAFPATSFTYIDTGHPAVYLSLGQAF